MDKLRQCPFCKSDNVRIFNIWVKPIQIVCNECHAIYPNLDDKYMESEGLEDGPNEKTNDSTLSDDEVLFNR